MKIGLSFARQLLLAQLTGLGVATGVSLFILPVSCRTLVTKQITSYLGALQKCLLAHKALLQNLEGKDAMSSMLILGSKPSPETIAVKASIGTLTTLHGKLQIDLPFAKKEIAYGKLRPDHFKELNKLLRMVMLPTIGMGSIIDILQQLATLRGWTEDAIQNLGEMETADRDRSLREWTSNMKLVHEPFEGIINVMVEAVEHVLLQLQFKKRPNIKPDSGIASTTDDIESTAQATAPGDPGFAAYLARKSVGFYQEKHLTLMEWARKRGIELPDDFFDHPNSVPYQFSKEYKQQGDAQRQQRQRQLYLLLYVSGLIFIVSNTNGMLDGVPFILHQPSTAEPRRLGR
jgi:hypothetical protein